MRRSLRLCAPPSLASCLIAVSIATAPVRAADFGPGFRVRAVVVDGDTVSTAGPRGGRVCVFRVVPEETMSALIKTFL